MYKLFICLRYLRARTISYIAIGALGLGVATLIIVTSVMGGFQREFHKKIRGTLADISVESRFYFGIGRKDPETGEADTDGEKLAAMLKAASPHVVATAPTLENIVLIDNVQHKDYGFLKGIDPVQEAKIGDFAQTLRSPREILEAQFEQYVNLRQSTRDMIEAASDVKPDPAKVFGPTPSGKPPILVGSQLFVQMNMDVGDIVKLVTTSSVKPRFEEKDVREQEFEVVGAFKTGMYEQDKRFLYAPLEAVQKFIGVPGQLSALKLKLDDYALSHEVADALRRSLKDPTLYFIPWDMVNENLIRAVATENWMIGFIVFFMIALAGLNLTAILTMLVIEKTKDLGILGAVGATQGGLFSIFLMQGGFIAVFGALFGTAFGYVFVDNINWIDRELLAKVLGHPVFNPEVYYLDRIPTEVNPWTIAICCGATVVLGFALAIYPAVRASRLEPIEALRYE
ncbi:MAG TPA: ABC transporter permease [Planctomycetota bacterium]|nr:ABC transporter permease [Planctomycetota bacterium]